MTTAQLLCVCLTVIVIVHEVSGARQACAKTDVNIRTGPSTGYKIVDVLIRGRCLPYRGLSRRRTWVKVLYDGRIRYIHKNYLTLTSTHLNPTPVTSTVNHTPVPPTASGCPNIITRAQWRAKAPKRRVQIMKYVPKNVYIHHAAGPPCSTTSVCKGRVRGYQNYHMNTRGWNDIAYSFLIGEDGNVYEGRGWMVVGGHTRGHNSDGYGICFIGDFSNRTPNSLALKAYRRLIQCGIALRKLRRDYVIKGHRDVGRTACPGKTFYNLIQNWSHYKNPYG